MHIGHQPRRENMDKQNEYIYMCHEINDILKKMLIIQNKINFHELVLNNCYLNFFTERKNSSPFFFSQKKSGKKEKGHPNKIKK